MGLILAFLTCRKCGTEAKPTMTTFIPTTHRTSTISSFDISKVDLEAQIKEIEYYQSSSTSHNAHIQQDIFITSQEYDKQPAYNPNFSKDFSL